MKSHEGTEGRNGVEHGILPYKVVFAYGFTITVPETPGISNFSMLLFNQQLITYLFRILSVAQIVLGTEDKMKSTSTVVGDQDDV